MSITLEQAKALKPGDIIHESGYFNSDRSCRRWTVNGKVKTWVTRPEAVKVPIKYGMYDYDYLREYNLENFHMPVETYGRCD